MHRRIALAWAGVALMGPPAMAQHFHNSSAPCRCTTPAPAAASCAPGPAAGGSFLNAPRSIAPAVCPPIPTRSAINRVGLERHWQAVVPLGVATERLLNITLSTNNERAVGVVVDASVVPDPLTGEVPPIVSFTAEGELTPLTGIYAGMRLLITGGPMRGTSRTVAAYDGPTRRFTFADPLPAAPEKGSTIAILDSLIFAQTSEANFYAFDGETGQLLWATNLSPNPMLGMQIEAAGAVAANSRAVFVTSASQLFALDRKTGRRIWMAELPAPPSGTLSVDEDQVIVALGSGRVVAYSLIDTRPARRVAAGRGVPGVGPNSAVQPPDPRGLPYLAVPVPLWSWQTDRPVVSTPLATPRVVSFGSQDGRVFTVLADTPRLVYRFATGGPITGPLGGYGVRTLIIPSTDNNVYGVDLFNGRTLWTFPSGAPVEQGVLVADDEAYIVNDAGALTSLDAQTGSPRWTAPTFFGRLLSVSSTRVYLETRDLDLFVIDRATGRILVTPRTTYEGACLNLREFTLGLTNPANDRLYFATPDGIVLSLREINQVDPRLLRDPTQKPFGYIPPEGYPDAPVAAPAPADPDAPPAAGNAQP